MRRLLALPTLLSTLMLLAGGQDPAPKPGAPDARARAAAQLRQLGWLAGTWVLHGDTSTTEEHWRPLQGTTMLGTSHSFDARRTHFFEFLRITIERDQVVYVAMPGGGAAVTFPLAQLEADVVEFENAAHDHPQRIRYQKTDAGVTATISQLDGSRAQAFEFKAR
ncbi:MAG: hypothetical protein JNM25_08530 [Planctomycetes bacterium]|nr:hypothetical protein [Planctomycetota bacterium]